MNMSFTKCTDGAMSLWLEFYLDTIAVSHNFKKLSVYQVIL